MGGKILCPFCFKKMPKNALEYVCTSQRCQKIITNAKPNRYGIVRCSCGHNTTTRRCPECHRILPNNILDGNTHIISIVGGASCGKSYFVATLIKQIMYNALLVPFGNIAVKWGISASREEYITRFKNNLDHFIPLRGTQYVTDVVKDNPPILIEMTRNERGLFGSHLVSDTFSFFDAAGESFEDADKLASITPYIQHSEAVVLILDPRQVEFVNHAVTTAMPNLPPVSDRTYAEILSNTVQILRSYAETFNPLNRKIKIPLCIAFSKWDLLLNTPGLLPDGMNVSDPVQLSGKYDESLCAAISEELRALLMKWEPTLVIMAEGEFEVVRYFAFSAWGTSDTGGRGAPPIASYRVEDPMLWVMRREKII